MERTVVAETEGLDGVGHGSGGRPDYSCVAGGGAFLSTPTDLVRFGSATLKPGLLKAETIAAFRTPPRLMSGVATTYALGWTVKSVQFAGEPTRIVSHRGSPAGGSVSLLTFPDLGLAIAAAANASGAEGVEPFALRVAGAFTRHRRDQPR
jgi:CubicO group peptidase (beta-lactamase class C family)